MAGCPGSEGRNTYRCSRHINSGNMECHPNRVEVDVLVAFVVAVLHEHLRKHGTKDALKVRLKQLLANRAGEMTQTEATLVELQGRQSTLKQQVKACASLIVKSHSAAEREAKEELATELASELNQVERRIIDLTEKQRAFGKHADSDLDVTLGFIDRLDRFLARADRKALRVLFEGLGVNLVVRFAANDGRAHGNRERVPVGATLHLGADGRSMRLPAEALTADGATPKTDAPGPLGRPGVSDSSTEVGRGESICTLVPTFLGIILREIPTHYAWPDVAKYKPPRIPPPSSGNWRRIRINQGGGICARELAELADISETTIYRWREEGLVPPFPTRDGVAMWSADEAAEWLGIIEAVVVRRVVEPGPGRTLGRLVG